MITKNKIFQGSLVAVITPMKDDNSIDYDALCKLVDWHVEQGSNGLVIVGTTGESASVTNNEHIQIVETAINQANGRIPIIAGCGSASTQKSVELVKSLNHLKADAYLCVTPYYVKALQEGLYRHFVDVANSSDSPLILYNVPNRTACDLNNKTVIKLAEHENIIGLKDAVGDLSRAKELIELIGQKFCLLSGDDPTAYEFIKLGGDGVITVTGNVAPKMMSQWCNLLLNGRETEAINIFKKLVSLHDSMFIESNPMPAKWALNRMGKIAKGIRLPLTQPTVDTQKLIENAMQKCAVL